MVKVGVSMLGFKKMFAELLPELKAAGADMAYWQVMDESFVPMQNDTLRSQGPNTISSANQVRGGQKGYLPFYTHLMIGGPIARVQSYARAGSDIIVTHYEADPSPAVAYSIRELDRSPGIAVKPGTDVSVLDINEKEDRAAHLRYVDHVLVMCVDPDHAGSCISGGFENRNDEVNRLADMRNSHSLEYEIAVVGHMNPENARIMREAGADIIIAGSFVRNASDYKEAIRQLRGD